MLKEAKRDGASLKVSPAPLPLRLKLLLAGFGTLLALLISIVFTQFVSFSPRGVEFESLQDLRAALVSKADRAEASVGADGNHSVSLRNVVQSHPDDSIIYTLKPNLDLTFVRARVKTNSCGMRSPERPLAKPPGVYRIALLGDSFAFGWGVAQEATFAQKLEDKLNSMAAGAKRFEVLNFGVPGYSTFQEVALFEERAIDFNPDAVLVYFVQNDFGMPFFIKDLNGSGKLFSSIKFVDLGRRLFSPESLNEKIASLGLDPNRALDRLAKLCQQHGIRVFVAINPRKSWKGDLQRLSAIRKNPNMTNIRLREGLIEHIKHRNIPESALTLSFDPHPSEIRHEILALLMTPYFVHAANL